MSHAGLNARDVLGQVCPVRLLVIVISLYDMGAEFQKAQVSWDLLPSSQCLMTLSCTTLRKKAPPFCSGTVCHSVSNLKIPIFNTELLTVVLIIMANTFLLSTH